MKRYILTAVAASVVTASLCQGRFAFSDTYNYIDTTRAGEVLLRIVNEDFFKNDEYFGDYVEGYTLVGYMLQPSIVYYPAANLSLEVGARMLQYGGDDSYDKVAPVLTVQWRMNPHFTVAMGAIPGGMHHTLHEAMWDDEYQLIGMPEIGAHVRGEAAAISGEVWINWQQFIKRYDTIPEKFTAGIAFDYHPSQSGAGWKFEMPLRIIVSHIGGQISDYEERMQSLCNGSLEARLRRVYPDVSFVREWHAALRGLFFYTMAGADVRPFANGAAFNPEVGLDARWFDLTLSYFAARNYYSLYGNPLYMSLSNYKEDVYNVHRNMAIVEGNINWTITPAARFSVGGKGYYDPDAQQMEYYYGFNLVLTPTLRLLRNVYPVGR